LGRGWMILLGVLFLFLFSDRAVDAGPATTIITLHPKAEIRDSNVRLGDIADIRNGDSRLIDKLQNIVIALAPPPGQIRNIDLLYIRMRMKQSDIDLSQVILESPETIEVSRKSVEIDRKMVEQMIYDFLDKKIPWEKSRTHVKLVQISEAVVLPDQPYTYKVIPPNRTNYLGLVPLTIAFDTGGQVKKVGATVKVEVETEAVVVKNPLIRNETITKDNVEVFMMDMADLPSNYISTLNDAIGKRALRAINPKEILRTDLIEFPPLVKRSDVVSIVAESGSLRIVALGEVKETGRSGERVKVMNLDSKKEIFARVVDSKTVQVDF